MEEEGHKRINHGHPAPTPLMAGGVVCHPWLVVLVPRSSVGWTLHNSKLLTVQCYNRDYGSL